MTEEEPNECGVEVVPTAEARRQLSANPEGIWDWSEGDSANCELEAGHAGQHVSHGQSGWDDYSSFWIVWSDSSPAVVELLPPCESDLGDDPDEPVEEELCILPAEHEGQHTGGSSWWRDGC